jgi:membrane protein required for colicin V production
LEESILYKPVKKVAPTIFPSIIKGEEDLKNPFINI